MRAAGAKAAGQAWVESRPAAHATQEKPKRRSLLLRSAPPFSALPLRTYLVVASDQVHRGRVLNLEGQQQADGL